MLGSFLGPASTDKEERFPATQKLEPCAPKKQMPGHVQHVAVDQESSSQNVHGEKHFPCNFLCRNKPD